MELRHLTSQDTGAVLALSVDDKSEALIELPLPEFDDRLQARFADFSLVKPFVRALLAHEPSSLSLDYLCNTSADLMRFALALNVRVSVMAGLDDVQLGDTTADQRWGRALLEALNTLEPVCSDWSSPEIGYERYALSSRNHNLLIQWVDRVMPLFEGRENILDIGCGTGIFLDQLARSGRLACGVDNNTASVRYARMLGLNVELEDARDFLERSNSEFDAIHCSHFVEHLPVDDLAHCMKLIARALAPGGKVVLVFPDPESIRSQLLGFWRDPDHVRFYHPDIIETMALSVGLELDSNSQRDEQHLIASFSMQPPESMDADLTQDGLVDCENPVQERLAIMERRIALQEQWIRQLWAVNQTWAWSDDAVLSFVRPK